MEPKEISSSVTCPSISVTSADYAECNGAYSVTDYVVLWAVDRPVYKHVAKDRYVGVCCGWK